MGIFKVFTSIQVEAKDASVAEEFVKDSFDEKVKVEVQRTEQIEPDTTVSEK